MQVSLYIEDLNKALVTPAPTKEPKTPNIGSEAGGAKTVSDPRRKLAAGVEYEYAARGPQPPGEGWERTSGEGWRRPLGSGGGKDKKIDTTGGETPEDQKKQANAGRTGTSDPFSPDPKDFESDDAFEHYRHIQVHSAQEGTDPKLTQMHRDLIHEKTKDFTDEDHSLLADKLRGADMPDEAARHESVAESMKANAQQTEGVLTPEQGEAKLKEQAERVKQEKEAAVSSRRVRSSEEKHAKAKSSHSEASKEYEEATKAHEESVKTTESSKAVVEKTKKDLDEIHRAYRSAESELIVSQQAAEEEHQSNKESQKVISEEAKEEASNKAGSTGMHLKKTEKLVSKHESDIEKLKIQINSNARKRLKLQEQLRAHTEQRPQHKDFSDTEQHSRAVEKHKLKEKAIKAKLNEQKTAVDAVKQELKEVQVKLGKAKAVEKKARSRHKEAMSSYKMSVKTHEASKKKDTKVSDTAKVIKAKEKIKKVSQDLAERTKKHKEAVSLHEKATKSEESAKSKADSAGAKVKKAEGDVAKTAEELEFIKKEEAQKAKDAEAKRAAKEQKEAERAKGRAPGILSGVRSGFSSGRAAGEAIGSAAARPEGSGAIASSALNYGTSGAVAMGHYLLYPKRRMGVGLRAR